MRGRKRRACATLKRRSAPVGNRRCRSVDAWHIAFLQVKRALSEAERIQHELEALESLREQDRLDWDARYRSEETIAGLGFNTPGFLPGP
jgi:hypothetical protein